MKSFFTVIIFCFLFGARGYPMGIGSGDVDDYNISHDSPYEDEETKHHLIEDLYGSEYGDGDFEGDEKSDDSKDEAELLKYLQRKRRQAGFNHDQVFEMASKHQDTTGYIPVGKIRPMIDFTGTMTDLNNYDGKIGVGLGSVIFRSPNKKHSLGAGVYVGQDRILRDGQKFVNPNYGAGLSYKFKFN
ncbi:hypothetical protein Anas_12226 [Armadillidium nasatum]|uniref:Uncharacterized protein n=1 Tax=Armadillidium nasatum TaxID=96803 RepID=A0A5N5T9I5_9CRUS|nr:hypothetical protein Anas_12226 [Armadillidium nasatum]